MKPVFATTTYRRPVQSMDWAIIASVTTAVFAYFDISNDFRCEYLRIEIAHGRVVHVDLKLVAPGQFLHPMCCWAIVQFVEESFDVGSAVGLRRCGLNMVRRWDCGQTILVHQSTMPSLRRRVQQQKYHTLTLILVRETAYPSRYSMFV